VTLSLYAQATPELRQTLLPQPFLKDKELDWRAIFNFWHDQSSAFYTLPFFKIREQRGN